MKFILPLFLLSSINLKFINLNLNNLTKNKNKNITQEKKQKIFRDLVGGEEDECLPSETDTIKIFKEKYNIDLANKKITKNFRFIAGNCNPVILIPGILSVALRAKIDCENLFNKEKDVYKKLKFFCQLDNVCPNVNDYYDEDFFLKINGVFGFIKQNNPLCKLSPSSCQNLYGACFSYLMNTFDKDECAKLDDNKSVCTISDYIKILFFGGTKDTYESSQCGTRAVRKIISNFDFVDFDGTKVFDDIIDLFINLGYDYGFSLGAIPNDFRRFATNELSSKIFRYLVESFYNNTGKPVIIIAHSFGNLITLNYLVNKENKDLIPKIKKFVSIGAPFAGSTELLNAYLHGLGDFDTAISEFHSFGQSLLFKSVPILSELRPMPVFSKMKEMEEYSQFVKVIKDRIDLENCIYKGNCDEVVMSNKNKEFEDLFSSYYPSLSSAKCKDNTKNKFQNKCFLNLYNIFDNPLIIQVNNTNEINTDGFNINDYCDKNQNKCFYTNEKGEEKRNIEELFTMGKYTYNMSEMKEFFDTYNKNKEQYGLNEDINYSDFETEEEFRKENLLQIERQKNKSLINELPIPPVDTDVVYTSVVSTDTGAFLEDDVLKDGKEIYSGGDGTVSTWSSLLVGLKWIYDKKRNNLSQKIKLVEYCSKLYNDFPFNETNNNFIALGCNCLKNNSYSNLDDCSHQDMLFDQHLLSYLKNIASTENEISNDRINAAKRSINRVDNEDYEKICNLNLFYLADSPEFLKSFNISELQVFYDDTEISSQEEKNGANINILNILLSLFEMIILIVF